MMKFADLKAGDEIGIGGRYRTAITARTKSASLNLKGNRDMTLAEYDIADAARIDAELYLITARALQSIVDPRKKPVTAAMVDKIVADAERDVEMAGRV